MSTLIRRLCLLCLVCLVVMPVAAQEDGAQVRIAHYAADAPPVEVYLGEELVLESLEPGLISPFMAVAAGDVAVAIAPVGEGMDAAVINTDVQAEAGHYYDVAVIGQAADDSLAPLVIDETAAMEGADLSQGVFRIIIHNIAGAPAISYYENGMWVERNIEYGNYSAALFPAFNWDVGYAVVGEDLDNKIMDFDSDADNNGGFWEPYMVYFYGMMGTYPGTMWEDYFIAGGEHYVTAQDPITFLEAMTAARLTYDYSLYYVFDTFVAGLRETGLDMTLPEGGPYTIFVPTDTAFESLPEGAIDPDALRDVLLNHVVEGDYTYDQLVEAGTVTTMGGGAIVVTPSEDDGVTFHLNGDAVVQNFDYPFINGKWRLWFIDNEVLMP